MSRTFQRRSKLERTIITSIQIAKHRETLWHSTSRRVEYVLSVATLVKRVTVSCTNGSNILLIRTMNGECKSFTRALMRLLRARSCVWIYALVRRERISIIASGLQSLRVLCASHCSMRQSGTIGNFLFNEGSHRIRKMKEIFSIYIYIYKIQWKDCVCVEEYKLCNRIIVDFFSSWC